MIKSEIFIAWWEALVGIPYSSWKTMSANV